MRISYSNVGSLGSGDFELAYGLNAVVGPNGSGKSTLVNALYFAFTGELLNGENIDSLITWGTSSCSVSVKGIGYSITRTVNKSGTNKVKFVRGDVTLNRKREVDQAICELFGFVDLSILRSVYFIEQFKATDFVDVTDSVRVQLLSELYGFARLEKLRSGLQTAINSIDVSTVGPDVLTQMRQALANSVEYRDSLIARQSELTPAILSEAELTSLNSVACSKDIGYKDSLQSALFESERILTQLRSELESLPRYPDAEDMSKYEAYKRHTELSAQLIKVNSELTKLVDSRSLSPEDISNFLQRAAAAKLSLEYKRGELENQMGLLKSGKCPLTGGIPCPDLKALTDESSINDKIGDIDNQIAQISADELSMKQDYEAAVALEGRITELQFQLKHIEEDLAGIPFDPSFDVAEYEQVVSNSSAFADRRKELEQQIVNAMATVASNRAAVENSADVCEYSQESRDNAKLEIEMSYKASVALSEISSMLPVAESSVADQQSSLSFAEAQNKLAEENAAKKQALTTVRLALHRDNLPKLLVEDMLGSLNSKLAEYLNRFNFPYEVRWSSSGALLYTSGNEWHRASQLSGGQKYVLVISMRCALADMLNSSFPLMVFDEPTTGLDVDNRESLTAVLSSVASSGSSKFLVVPTHDDMLLPEANIINVG